MSRTPCTDAARGRRRRSVVAGALATTVLSSLALIGSPTPAHADDGQQANVDEKLYQNEQDVLTAMEKWAPVKPSESVMGYPKGLDRDKDGNVKAITLADVQPKYDPNEAVKDAELAAAQYAADTKNPAPLRASAEHLSTGWPGSKAANGPDIRPNTKNDVVGGQPAEQYCNMVNKDPDHAAFGQTAPCIFVGKVDEKWPVRGSTDGVAGGGTLNYKVSGSVTDEKSTTEGWSAGGKISPKITGTPAGDKGGAGGEIGGEVSFTYSYSSTSLKRVMNTLETSVQIEVPNDKKGYLEGRANGAYYTGYIVVRDIDGNNQESLVAIPARAYVQAPDTTSPQTWFKRLTPA
ncbi:hypothetical protein [Streptomyces sioyaensis]|uniref:hypothetical protein n=1 Tax=Streptomyces sioyaensis TaxID=67364 RepID=UPI0036EE9EAF